MRVIIKILLIIFVIFSLLFVAGYIFVAAKGKALINNYIQKNIGRKIDFERVSLALPFNLKVDNLKIEELAKIKKIIIYPDISGIISGRISFHSIRIINPVVSIIREKTNNFNFSPFRKKELIPAKEKKDGQILSSTYSDLTDAKKNPTVTSKDRPELFFNKIIINDGELVFIDKNIKKEGFPIKLNNIDITLSDVYLPVINAKFEVSSNILGRPKQQEGVLTAKGWLNLKEKNMSLDLEIVDVDGVYISEYIKRYFQAKLVSADISVIFHAEAIDNILNGKGKLIVENFELEKREGMEGSQDVVGPLAGIILQGLTSPDKRIELDLELRETNLDKPQFRLKRLAGSIARPMVEQLLTEPGGETIEKFKDIGEKFKSIGKELEGIFKDKKEDNVEEQKDQTQQQLQQQLVPPALPQTELPESEPTQPGQ